MSISAFAPWQSVNFQGGYILYRFVIGFVLSVFIGFSCAANIEDDIKSEILEASTSDRWVEMSFDISELGQPTNIKVIKSTHKGLLDKAAIRALEKWKYKPKIVDGVAVVQKDLKVRLQFDIENDES